MQGLPLVYLFLYLIKQNFFFFGGGYLRSWCLGYPWECSEGDGVRNFEYIGPADAFDCARLSWPMCPVGKWLPGTAFPRLGPNPRVITDCAYTKLEAQKIEEPGGLQERPSYHMHLTLHLSVGAKRFSDVSAHACLHLVLKRCMQRTFCKRF